MWCWPDVGLFCYVSPIAQVQIQFRFRFRFENQADLGKISLFFTFSFELFIGATLPCPFFLESWEPDPGNVLKF